MKLSRKSEYACLALVHLSKNYNGKPLKIIEISNESDIPKKYLEQILLLLKGSGYVYSNRGASGGYSLQKKPDEITLAEIFRLIDGPIASISSVSTYFYQKSPLEKNDKLIHIMKDIRDYASDILEKTTFQDLI